MSFVAGSVTRLTEHREYIRGLKAATDCQRWHEYRFCSSKNLPCRRHLSIGSEPACLNIKNRKVIYDRILRPDKTKPSHCMGGSIRFQRTG